MAYILYINGHEMELGTATPISQTRQVNDLAKLDNRQSSVTNKFTLPFTPKNVKSMEHVYLTGNQSNVPYQKNVASLYDAESGACLIYKGWATITQSSKKGYDVFIYDGLIDFYRKIENKTLKDIGISELNHAKTILNITNSWNNDLPYIYAIADYNGKNQYEEQNGQLININTDYQVPSARVSYLWDKIFEFSGFTFTGSYFQSEKFLNLFLTFPKPVPFLVPSKEIIYTGTCSPIHSTYWYFSPDGSYLNAESYLLTLPRENFNSIFAQVNDVYNSTPITAGGSVYNHNRIKIITPGKYAIDGPANINFLFYRRDQNDVLVESGTVELDYTGNLKTYIFDCLAGDQIAFIINELESSLQNISFNWTFSKIIGFEANFEEAFLEFKVTDFVNEIIQQAGLTAFKDKYKNNIEYLTMGELLQSSEIIDWSNKYQYKDIEKYKIGSYAKKNKFKYKYNATDEDHFDGFIKIDNQNLEDEITTFQSVVYAPEKKPSIISDIPTNTYKIWEKEADEDATIKYKELSGKFYFIRQKKVQHQTKIGSEIVNESIQISEFCVSDYSLLSFKQLIINNYSAIEGILDKAKLTDAYFYLNPIDIKSFDFKKLIYVEQLSSYFLVNKILNFVKGKITKCEIIEVDYKKNLITTNPPGTGTFINITNVSIAGCQVTINFTTDASDGSVIELFCGPNTFGNPPIGPIDPMYYYQNSYSVTGPSMSITFDLQAGTFYDLYLQIQGLTPNVISNHIYFENSNECQIYSPNNLQIVSATLLNQDDLQQDYQIIFTTDSIFPAKLYLQNYKPLTPIDPQYPYLGSTGGWSGYNSNEDINQNSIIYKISRINSDATKVQIRIGLTNSNEFNL